MKKIHHPRPRTPVKPSFVAFGRADAGTGHLTGVLLNGPTAVVGATLMDGPKWIILFEDVPVADDYVLVIQERGGSALVLDHVHVRGAGSLGISYPNSEEQVCTDFVSYGSVSPVAAVTVTMGSNNGNVLPAKPGQTTWVAQFLGVADGDYGTLNATSSSGSDVKTNIHVRATNC